MIVPLMIWSARIEMLSQAWSTDTTAPASIAANTPISNAGVAANNPSEGSPPMALLTTRATMNPAKALISIIPSMPMLTTPLRSFITPQSAPSAIGTASPSTIGAMSGITEIRYAMNWMTYPSTGML